jgi:hypothetical protein
MFCPSCGLGQPDDHRFCVACGRALPGYLLQTHGPKVSRWFLGLPVAPSDRAGSALRVSRYVGEVELDTPEGSASVPSHHVRFSIWIDDRAVAAISLTDDESTSVAGFLLAAIPDPPSPNAAFGWATLPV